MTPTKKALEVIYLANKAINSTPNGISFFRIKNYKSVETGEVANHLVNIGVSFSKAVEKDIDFLKNLDVRTMTWKSSIIDIEIAKTELLNSLITPNQNRSDAQKDAYTIICEGVKVHNETGILYVWGHTIPEKKEIIVEGVYKKVNSKPLTIAKNEIRKLLKSTKYRLFKVDVGNVLKSAGEVVEI